ncbi:MAG: GntP family permease [Smithellaceae bacterium]
MDASMLSFIGIVLGLAFLIVLALRGWSIVIIAPIAAIIVLLFSGESLLKGLNDSYMKGFSSFAMKFFLIFLLGTIFGKIMEDSGAAKKIADFLLKLTGRKKQFNAAMAIVGVCALLAYGGVSVFVIIFVIIPIARPLFKEIDLSWHIFPGIFCFGIATFVMGMLPGTPQIQNIIPMKYLGTTPMAAPALGIIATVLLIVANSFVINWFIKRLKDRGQGYEGSDPAGMKSPHLNNSDEEPTPKIWLAILPSLGLLILLNIFKVDVIWALLGGIVIGLVVFYNYLPNKLSTLTAGATNSAIPLINTCADVGFGSVVGAVAGFKMVSAALMNIPGSPAFSLSLATQLLCGITGSASGGLGIAMELFSKHYLALGMSPELIHRVASIATAGLDVMPHNGGVITIFALVGLTHKDAYKYIFVFALLVPIITNLLALLLSLTFIY